MKLDNDHTKLENQIRSQVENEIQIWLNELAFHASACNYYIAAETCERIARGIRTGAYHKKSEE